jgi:hypothetical protein
MTMKKGRLQAPSMLDSPSLRSRAILGPMHEQVLRISSIMTTQPRRAGPESTPQPRRSRRWYFVAFAATVCALVVAGFSRTFFMPLAHGTFTAPWFVHVHGALFFSWLALLTTQSILIARGRRGCHRRLGWISVGLIPLMVVSGSRVGVWATLRDVNLGRGDDALVSFFGQLTDMALFAGFASTAIVMRHRPEAHKRWILLATLAVLGAAVGRIPVLGDHADTITFALIASIAVRDFVIFGRLHTVTLCGGLGLVVGTLLQTPIASTTWWLATGRSLLALFTS